MILHNEPAIVVADAAEDSPATGVETPGPEHPNTLTAQRCHHPGCEGLVTCAITGRHKDSRSVSAVKAGFSFPTVDECRAGAAAVGSWEWNGREGAVPQVEVFPGLIRLTAPDLNRRERSANRRADAPLIVSKPVEVKAGEDGTDEVDQSGGEDSSARGVIAGWSRRSRARMVSSMAEIDLAPILMAGDQPAMVTLTYPADWETVAPDGEIVKSHLLAFFRRFERAWGMPWMGLWKMEFQRRGAPHFHLLMTPPAGIAGTKRWEEYQGKLAAHPLRLERFEREMQDWNRRLVEWVDGGGDADDFEKAPPKPRRPRWNKTVGDELEFRPWLSKVWADIVDHPDPVEKLKHELAGTAVDFSEGDRARDPKRAAVYFGKHGSFAAKDYQHEVPELWQESGKSVGRFWGYRGLEKVKGAATLEFDSMLLLGRVLRRYGTRTRVWNPLTRSHEFRPVLATKIKPRLTVLPCGTIKPARDPETGEVVVDEDGVPVPHVRYRKQTVRAKRMAGPMGAGFLLVNDGPEMARVLARVLETCGPSQDRAPVGMRGPIGGRGR